MVLGGINGAGKSSILDALAILLSWYSARIRRENTPGRSLTEIDIQNEESYSTLQVRVRVNEKSISWRQVKTRPGRQKGNQSDYSELNSCVKTMQQRLEESQGNVSVPVLVYYPVNRSVVDIPLRIKTKHNFDDPLSAYDDDGGSLTSGSNFRVFFEWFREIEDLENEKKAEYFDMPEQPNPLTPIRQLEAVRTAITTFTGFQDLRIRRQPLRMELKKGNESLRVEQLSDGEKCLLAVVGDLARRLAIANPGKDPFSGSGIVLIDEVELHLHPQWQRMIIQNLQKTFRNCQFIVTTHSPQILSHVDGKNIFLLHKVDNEGITCKKPIDSYGISSDRILEDLMDVSARPDDIKQELENIFRLIDNNELARAESAITRIRSQIGEDPELVKANALIRRKRLIRK